MTQLIWVMSDSAYVSSLLILAFPCVYVITHLASVYVDFKILSVDVLAFLYALSCVILSPSSCSLQIYVPDSFNYSLTSWVHVNPNSFEVYMLLLLIVLLVHAYFI